MTYDLSCLENLTGPAPFVTCINDLSGGIVGILMLGTIFVISFKYLSDRGVSEEQTMVYSFFITEFFSVLLWALQLIVWQYSIIPLILLFLSFIIVKFRD